ncbi:MAG: acyl-CoA desaturase [Chloroflexi bacterium]|nr:acyl-CoA desaturase [Chloroflexota bacterium]
MIGTQNAAVATEAANSTQTNIYPALRQLIKDQGLLDRQPAYYTYKMISTLGLMALSITFLVILDNTWLLLANAAFLAFAFGQSGYIGHDAGHRAVFRSLRGNEILGLTASFLLGMSRTWWVTAHNQHHSTPNDLEQDPHTKLQPFSFSQELASRRSKVMRFVVGYQAYYFVPTLLLESLALRLASFQFLWSRRKAKYARTEFFLMGLHFVLYFGLLFYFLSPWQVLGFFLVHQGLFGLYYGTVFAPNHKGMLIIDKDKPLDFLRTQVLTTRNVKPGPIADFWYGGLNYQIEHHLFPIMPRNNFGKARKIIKAFCQQHNVPYHETGTFKSYREIFSYLHQVGEPVRSWPKVQKQLASGQ